MQTPSPSLLQQITSLSSYPISSYSTKIKVDITFPVDEDRTKQSFKAEADINHIMARYQRTGVLDFAQKHEPQYGDVTGLDFEVGMQAIARAKAMFADLPSSVRARFDNNPAEFLDFVQDERNRDEARAMGLLKPEARAEALAQAPSQNAARAATAAPGGNKRQGGKGAQAPTRQGEDKGGDSPQPDQLDT